MTDQFTSFDGYMMVTVRVRAGSTSYEHRVRLRTADIYQQNGKPVPAGTPEFIYQTDPRTYRTLKAARQAAQEMIGRYEEKARKHG